MLGNIILLGSALARGGQNKWHSKRDVYLKQLTNYGIFSEST
jgi:hypothetical protein